MAFIKNRSISDSILIANEVAHSILSMESKGVIIKLDFAKAFDSVNWTFLKDTMLTMNFNSKWTHWIISILRSAWPSILVNGSPSREFQMHQGLRQGDPLSPLLYNLVGEMLHLFLSKANKLGIIKGIELKSGMQITHLQFADDTILFVRNESSSITWIKVLLKLFELMSGLRINFHKSSIYGHQVDRMGIEQWSRILKCKVGSWPISYLGASLGNSPKKVKFWDPLVQNLHKKMKQWKNAGSSIAGRLIILKAVLNSIPIYWLNLYKIPATVIKRIDKIRRDFLWNGLDNSNRKMHLIN